LTGTALTGTALTGTAGSRWSIGSGRARGALWAGLVLRGCGGIGTRRTRRRVGGLGQRE
jgi:hypothetical protein